MAHLDHVGFFFSVLFQRNSAFSLAEPVRYLFVRSVKGCETQD